MDEVTVPAAAPFDQRDIELEAHRVLEPILNKGDNEKHRLAILAAIGRRLCFSRSSISQEQRFIMYTLMYELTLDGLLKLPARIKSHNMARVLTYEALCRQIYTEVSK